MVTNVEIATLLSDSRPSDEELADLIETAFLEGQIDGDAQAFSFAWLASNDISEN